MGGYRHTVILQDLVLFINDSGKLSVGLVLEYHSKDLKKIMDMSDQIIIHEDHIVKVLYSLLCSLNFIHSANILHRDLKPANILFKSDCKITLCDFGLSRTLNVTNDIKRECDYNRSLISKYLQKDKPERKLRKRELSPHTVTRFYRPPEIILLERQYDTSVDLWSTGVTMLEFLNCSSSSKQNGVQAKDRQPFMGKSCFPMSPKNKNTNEVGRSDQLKVILNILGFLTDDEKTFLSFDKQSKHLSECESNLDKIQFHLEFPEIDRGLLDAFSSLL
mmetsp:Transcript_13022/g.20200  ORF Transcript_13022/g.20200 Transcript_13022/m.20200 type:complete len:276 (+) Transcript_13022:339-1166(+)